ncbi:MAG: ParB/RepB/Spo0J family partition protein, partial [bacterium]
MSALNSHNALGRGMNSLLSSDFDKSILLDESERIQKIAINQISPNVNQPRKEFNRESISELAESIKVHGVLQPLIVAPVDGEKDKYSIIAGERRWRASKLANLKTVPVIVRDEKEDIKLEIALIENIQRVNLSPMELAKSVNELHSNFNIT